MNGLDLKKKRFGSLQILCRWGRMASNVVWVYYCLRCGHVGKRLGTHLAQGVRTSCPSCGAVDPPAGSRAFAKKPTKERLTEFLRISHARYMARPARTKRRQLLAKRLGSVTDEELARLFKRVTEELELREGAPK